MSAASTPTIELSKLSLEDYDHSRASSPGSPELLSPSLPGAPSRPKRSPLRVPSQSSLRSSKTSVEAESSSRSVEVRQLGLEISKLHDRMYEIQELRHSSTASTERLNMLLSSLSELIDAATPKFAAVIVPADVDLDTAARIEDVRQEWSKLLQRHKTLGEEMKEDGWLIRFRTTADQAEAMMDPLQKSQLELSRCLEGLGSSEDLRDLLKLNQAHESLRSTYVPSINKILNMMDRSLNERVTKNGEALRRYSDMETRWVALQRSLAHLDARVRLMVSQTNLNEGDVEVLEDTSPNAQSRSDKADYHQKAKHRQSMSSTPSRTASGSSPSTSVLPSPVIPPTTLRRRPSLSADKPRWNASIHPGPTLNKRASFGYTGIGRPPSPTGSSMSGQSRLPPPATPRRVSGMPQATSPQATTPPYAAYLTVPSPLTTPAHPSMYRAPHTTHVPRSVSRASNVPTQSMSAPRTRASRIGGPPSAYRPTTPSLASRAPPRPSSRLSMTGSVTGQVAGSARQPAHEIPFQPSKYDLLDQAVAAILAEEEFDLFVSRIDPPLVRGQRRAEGEEWKGEYVFGAGEKSSPVKLLTLVGAKLGLGKNAGAEKRTKCLVKAHGMWLPLADLLRERKAKHGDIF